MRDNLAVHAMARVMLHGRIDNIQTSWVKMGPAGAAICLKSGANDLGGTLMNESISRAAGTQHGQEFPPHDMEELIRSIGREPMQRDTLYRPVAEEREHLVLFARGRAGHRDLDHARRAQRAAGAGPPRAGGGAPGAARRGPRDGARPARSDA